MAEKSKSKTTRGKAKAAKPAEVKTAKVEPAAPASKAAAKATGKTAAAKTTAKAGKKAKAGKAAAGSKAAKPPKSATPPAQTRDEQHEDHSLAPQSETFVDTFYVCSGVLPIEIRDTPPAGGSRSVEFSSYADARDHFLNELIEAIEHYERLLHAVRSAASFADYLDQQG